MYRWLGAHPQEREGVCGTQFSVWAPNAREVSVLCDRNAWTHGRNPLQSSDSGVWHGFVEEVGHLDAYKYGIRCPDGTVIQKADPCGFFSEVRPKSATIVYELSDFPWQDQAWLRQRECTNWLERPVSVYESHLGSWQRPKDGRDFFNYR